MVQIWKEGHRQKISKILLKALGQGIIYSIGNKCGKLQLKVGNPHLRPKCLEMATYKKVWHLALDSMTTHFLAVKKTDKK